jgi:hypothetical protein
MPFNSLITDYTTLYFLCSKILFETFVENFQNEIFIINDKSVPKALCSS